MPILPMGSDNAGSTCTKRISPVKITRKSHRNATIIFVGGFGSARSVLLAKETFPPPPFRVGNFDTYVFRFQRVNHAIVTKLYKTGTGIKLSCPDFKFITEVCR